MFDLFSRRRLRWWHRQAQQRRRAQAFGPSAVPAGLEERRACHGHVQKRARFGLQQGRRFIVKGVEFITQAVVDVGEGECFNHKGRPLSHLHDGLPQHIEGFERRRQAMFASIKSFREAIVDLPKTWLVEPRARGVLWTESDNAGAPSRHPQPALPRASLRLETPPFQTILLRHPVFFESNEPPRLVPLS